MRVLQFTLFGLLLASCSAYAQLQYNLSPGITPGSRDIYNLHMTVFWVCVGIGVIVFGTMIYAMLFHRKSLGVKPAQFHENRWIELLWTLIPVLILVALAIPGSRVLISLNDNEKSDLTIKVTGYQWKWRYEYVGYGISFFSNISTPFDQRSGNAPKNPHYLLEVDNPLVLPTHKKIRFLVTSNDVIHSWWVPAFGVKRDGVPGYINETWTRINRAGTFRGQCVQLCGMNHGFMPIVVEAKNEKEFDDWVKLKGGKGSVGGPAAPAAAPAPVPATSAPAPATSAPAPATPAPAPTTPAPAPATPAPAPTTPAPTPAIPAPAPTTPAPAPATPAPAPTTPAPAPATPAPVPATPASAPTTAASASTPAPTASSNKLSKDALMKRGQQIYETTCIPCHQPGGVGMPPVYPSLKGSSVVKGPVSGHIDVVVHGRPGTAMQAFGEQMSDEDLASIITYERNSWDNNMGDSVQPEQIAAAKQQGSKP